MNDLSNIIIVVRDQRIRKCGACRAKPPSCYRHVALLCIVALPVAAPMTMGQSQNAQK